MEIWNSVFNRYKNTHTHTQDRTERVLSGVPVPSALVLMAVYSPKSVTARCFQSTLYRWVSVFVCFWVCVCVLHISSSAQKVKDYLFPWQKLSEGKSQVRDGVCGWLRRPLSAGCCVSSLWWCLMKTHSADSEVDPTRLQGTACTW